MVKLPVAQLDAFFAAAAASRKLYLPVDTSAGQSQYLEWKPGTVMSNALNTVRSAKDFFFPQTENIVDFKMEGKKIEVIDNRKEADDFVLFGVRGCDVASFSILDRVFLAEPVDSFYKTRREHGLVISLACTRPEAICFCPLFGIDATNPGGDITSWIAGDEIFFEPVTEKGTAFLDSLKGLLSPADSAAVDAQKKETAAILEKLPFSKVKMEKFTGENLMKLFSSSEWSKLSEACLACGTCTFVCPTCQCYDIKDFDTGHGVKRFRCWDSCMYSEFTKMAHGNPRLTQIERFRQRFMHKLVYFRQTTMGRMHASDAAAASANALYQ